MSILQDFALVRNSPHHLKMLTLFVVTSFAAIFTTTLVLGTVLANYMTQQMTQLEAIVSAQYLNSIVRGEKATRYFYGEHKNNEMPEIKKFFLHVSQLPEVIRANVYTRSGEIIWSSDSNMVGRTFENNENLAAALSGSINPHLVHSNRSNIKDDHIGLPDDITRFIEYYIPIWSTTERRFVVGVVEVYKVPKELLASLHKLRTMAWAGAGAAGTLLFAALLLVVGYSSRVLRRQEQRLIETEKLAVVGEMASAVAHGLRNPLTAIRSCAELVADDPIPDSSKSILADIIDQVDRLEGWIRSFLIRNRTDSLSTEAFANVTQLIQRCIDNFQPQMEKRGIRVVIDNPNMPVVVATAGDELEQVINSILSNAVEAMNTGGELTISWQNSLNGRVTMQVTDTGPGISEEDLASLFVPFQTGKSSGLGVGLALAYRITERLGGHLKIANREHGGVDVSLDLPAHK